MQRGYAVDGMAAQGGEMRHAHISFPALIDQRQPGNAIGVGGVLLSHLIQMPAIDLVHNFKMPRQQGTKQAPRPLLQSLGQQCVVGIRERMLCHAPCGFPLHGVFIHQQAHQFGHRDGRMRVVHLNGEVAVQVGQRALLVHLNLQNMLQAAGDKEELLLQAQLLSLKAFVVGIENLGYVLGCHFVANCAEEIPSVEGAEVETLDSLCRPEAHGVGGVGFVAEDWGVMGNAAHDSLRNPMHVQVAVGVGVPRGVSAHLHFKGILGAFQRPWVAQPQPFVGGLDLPAVANLLVEDAKFVADAVADGGYVERGQRVHEAGSQAAQAAVAKSRLFFLLDQHVQIKAELAHRLLGFVVDAQVDEVVRQMRSSQELR